MTNDSDLRARIGKLVAEEHDLRRRRAEGSINGDAERARLQALEVELDQCWDLLRQREALRDAGENPDEAQVRPPSQVEGYLG
jgi:hypothetical protein